MLVKKLKFDDDVLAIIAGMEWENDGKLGRMTCGQLDRKMYTAVNKALEAMGGKWSRKDNGHVFKTDPRGDVEGLLSGGVLEVERDGFFETPDAVIDRMFELVPPEKVRAEYLEPSAGLGAIVRRLFAKDLHYIDIVEKNVQRYDELAKEFGCYPGAAFYHGDFLNFSTGQIYNYIYMNPPFENLQDIDHIQHAYNLLSDNGAMVSVMAESAFFREDKKSVAFRGWLDSVNGTSEKLPEGSFKSSGTMVNTRLVVIKK